MITTEPAHTGTWMTGAPAGFISSSPMTTSDAPKSTVLLMQLPYAAPGADRLIVYLHARTPGL